MHSDWKIRRLGRNNSPTLLAHTRNACLSTVMHATTSAATLVLLLGRLQRVLRVFLVLLALLVALVCGLCAWLRASRLCGSLSCRFLSRRNRLLLQRCGLPTQLRHLF